MTKHLPRWKMKHKVNSQETEEEGAEREASQSSEVVLYAQLHDPQRRGMLPTRRQAARKIQGLSASTHGLLPLLSMLILLGEATLDHRKVSCS